MNIIHAIEIYKSYLVDCFLKGNEFNDKNLEKHCEKYAMNGDEYIDKMTNTQLLEFIGLAVAYTESAYSSAG